MKKFKPILFTLLIAIFLYYFMLPPLNLSSMSFWSFLILLVFIYWIIYSLLSGKNAITGFGRTPHFGGGIKSLKDYGKTSLFIFGSFAAVMVIIIIINIIFSPLFSANKYANRITINTTDAFTEDVAQVDFSKIPLLDKESSQKLGDRKMGEMTEWVSQFHVSELYTQINYNNNIVRVTPLEYASFIKFLTNMDTGVKGYITVDSVTGNSNLVQLDDGMKYMPSAYFSKDLYRHLRFNYPTEIFGEESFEIDEEGNPYWIIPTIKYTGVELLTDIDGVIILNAITGESTKYDYKDIPAWIDHVYSADLIIEQVDDWGTYNGGFFNSIFGQKNVVNTTVGYNYTILGDDVYLYTGITSVASDESNLGFILVNMRTKEANFYSVAGAEEYSAMASAEGLVQEKGYISSFPLLINLNNRPTYLMSLKDAAGLVKMYAFVDVVDYQIVSTSDSSLGIDNAAKEYLNKINKESNNPTDLEEKTIKIKSISAAVIEGTTYYYITDTNNLKYQVSIKVNEYEIPFLRTNDSIKVTYTENEINIIKTLKID